MYIVAIAWLFVALMAAITSQSIFGGLMLFIFYGFLPCALLIWIIGTPQRRRNKTQKQESAQITQQDLGQPDGADAKTDE